MQSLAVRLSGGHPVVLDGSTAVRQYRNSQVIQDLELSEQNFSFQCCSCQGVKLNIQIVVTVDARGSDVVRQKPHLLHPLSNVDGGP